MSILNNAVVWIIIIIRSSSSNISRECVPIVVDNRGGTCQHINHDYDDELGDFLFY